MSACFGAKDVIINGWNKLILGHDLPCEEGLVILWNKVVYTCEEGLVILWNAVYWFIQISY